MRRREWISDSPGRGYSRVAAMKVSSFSALFCFSGGRFWRSEGFLGPTSSPLKTTSISLRRAFHAHLPRPQWQWRYRLISRACALT